jgi:hypothetical protein
VTKRLSFLLLDANIIIELWRLGLWCRLVELCDIHVGKTVVGEADYDCLQGTHPFCRPTNGVPLMRAIFGE